MVWRPVDDLRPESREISTWAPQMKAFWDVMEELLDSILTADTTMIP